MTIEAVPHSEGQPIIAALRAEPGVASRSPFGPADEIGMLNLVTPASMQRVFSSIDAHKAFDLAVDYFIGMPAWTGWGDPPFSMWMTATPAGSINDDVAGLGKEEMRRRSRSSDAFSMFVHLGTHIDTLNHVAYDGVIWNCFNHHDHLGSKHWYVCGPEKHPPLISRAVLIDVAGAHGVDVLPDHYGIDGSELERVLAHQGTTLRVGDIVLIRTGRMSYWPDGDRFMPAEPGITLDGARFLAEAGAIVIGADNVGLEVHPETWSEFQPVHTYLLTEAGVPVIEAINLEEIAGEKLYEFAFIGACMKIRGATGAPLRPVAFPLSR
jgi:kynurenine formamidase